MIKSESTNMSVYNPFQDRAESIYAEINLHYDGYKLDGVEILKLITDDGVDLYDHLHPKIIEDLEDKELLRQATLTA